jgi:hypothetical protein
MLFQRWSWGPEGRANSSGAEPSRRRTVTIRRQFPSEYHTRLVLITTAHHLNVPSTHCVDSLLISQRILSTDTINGYYQRILSTDTINGYYQRILSTNSRRRRHQNRLTRRPQCCLHGKCLLRLTHHAAECVPFTRRKSGTHKCMCGSTQITVAHCAWYPSLSNKVVCPCANYGKSQKSNLWCRSSQCAM